jgi:CheY-like chemotaxis protein
MPDPLGLALARAPATFAIARQAVDGQSAVTTVPEFRPDVAILDIGMPAMNGYAVAEAIRDRSDGAPVVLVALSGSGSARTRSARSRPASIGNSRHRSISMHRDLSWPSRAGSAFRLLNITRRWQGFRATSRTPQGQPSVPR